MQHARPAAGQPQAAGQAANGSDGASSPRGSGGGGAASLAGLGTAISTDGLTKRFRSGQVAVDGIDLRVPRGAIYGFIGPNGSGKTTTIRMLLGLVSPTSGTASLLGGRMPEAGRDVLPRVGTLVEGPAFHPYLSGIANLHRVDAADATANPRTRATRTTAALERVGLAAAAKKNYRQYSLGMKQRLGLAAALLQPRDLLILDEPTNGLDPQGTREVRTLLREIADQGATVLVSSHLLGEIEQVCTHVGIMSRGHLVAQGTPHELAAGAETTVSITTTADHAEGVMRLLTGLGLVGIRRATDTQRDGVVLTAPLGTAEPQQIAGAVVLGGYDLLALHTHQPSLESVFVSMTGEGFDVAR